MGAAFKMATLVALEGVAILATLGISARTRVKTPLFGLFRPKQGSRWPPYIGGHLDRFPSQTAAGIGGLEVAAGEGQITLNRYSWRGRAAGRRPPAAQRQVLRRPEGRDAAGGGLRARPAPRSFRLDSARDPAEHEAVMRTLDPNRPCDLGPPGRKLASRAFSSHPAGRLDLWGADG